MRARTFAAFLVNSLGQIRGKKAFQKYVYLAKAYGIPIKHSYKMHYYGPYSDTLAEDFDEIYLEDVIDKAPGSDYIYTGATKTREALDEGQEEIKKYQTKLKNLLSKFGKMSPKELEIYATTHFVWRIQGILNRPTDRDSVIRETKKAKYPKFSIPEIEQAYDNLVEWGLIKSNWILTLLDINRY